MMVWRMLVHLVKIFFSLIYILGGDTFHSLHLLYTENILPLHRYCFPWGAHYAIEMKNCGQA